MTETIEHKRVIQTDDEERKVIAAGIKLEQSGWVGGFIPQFLKAQEVLPAHRRRSPNIQSTSGIRWFVDAIKAFRNSPEAALRVDQGAAEATVAASGFSASNGEFAHAAPKRIVWTPQEQRALCDEAARLLMDLQVGSPHEALIQAQERVLASNRRRAKVPPSSVAHWYPEGRQEAMARLQSKRQREAAEAELAKVKEQLVAQTAAPAPAPIPDRPTPQTAPAPAPHEAPPPALAPLAPAEVVLPSPNADLASHLFGLWRGIRERLVQEVSDVFVEGIHRGMQRITLMQPPTEEACSSAAPEQAPTAAGDAASTKTKPGQSVLVVGLKGSQPEHIKADFAGKLDLRFCGADQSKDQLRSMASAADVTVAVTDFISHSHEDIIKARAPRFIRCAGGITHLKQELARLSSASHMNGQAHA